MLLKSKSSTEPRSDALSASRARPRREVRRRSGLTRSSQSTFIEPGDGMGRVVVTDCGGATSTALTEHLLARQSGRPGVCAADAHSFNTTAQLVQPDVANAYHATGRRRRFRVRVGGNGTEPEYAEIGDRLRVARTTRGLSLRALADRLRVSPRLISQVERGLAKPSVNTLYALARELDVSLDELLFVDAGADGSQRVARSPAPPPTAPRA